MAVATDHYFESCGKTTAAIDNSVHCKTRVKIEQMFRIWKSRFRCLHKSGGGGGQHDMSSWTLYIVVIVATAILHNICIVRRMPLPDDDDRAS